MKPKTHRPPGTSTPTGKKRVEAVRRSRTPRRRVKIAAHPSEQRYRQLFESVPDVILTLSPDGKFTSLNAAFEKLTQWSRKEWIGKSFLKLVLPADRPLALEMLALVRRGEQTPVFEIHVRTKRGEILVSQFLGSPELKNGRVVGALGIARNLTERKRAEEVLRAQDISMRMALEAAGMVTWEWDVTAGTIRYSDNVPSLASGEAIAPYCSVEGLLQQVHPDDRERLTQAISRTVTENVPYDCEYRVRMLDGNYHWILGRGMPVLVRNGKPVRLQGVSMDITGRKETEEKIRQLNETLESRVRERTDQVVAANAALRQRDDHLRVALAASGSNIWLWEANSNRLTGDEGFYAMFGLATNEPITYVDWLKRLHPEDQERMQKQIQTVLVGNEDSPWNAQFRVVQPDRGVRWIEGSGLVQRDREGRLVAMTGINLDITDRKRTEKAVLDSQALYHSLVEQMPVGLFHKDKEGRFVYGNPFFCQLQELTMEEIAGTSPPELRARRIAKAASAMPLGPNHPAQSVRHHELIMQTGQTIVVEETWRRQGSPDQHFEVVKTPVFDSAGKITGSQGILFDITKRKQAEQALRASEERFQKAFQVNPVGQVITALKDSRIIDVNPAYCQMVGYAREELIDRTTVELNLWNDPADRQRFVQTLMQGGRVQDVENRYRTRTGDIRYLIISMESIELLGETCVLSFALDITRRKQTEEEIRRLNASLEQRVRERTAELEAANQLLRRSEIRLKQAVHAGNVGLWDWDLTTNKVFYSPEWKQQIGYADHEISDDFQEWKSRVHPDDLKPILEKISAHLKQPLGQYRIEHRLRHKDGSYRWIESRGSLLPGEVPPRHLLGANLDITERKHAEEKLRTQAWVLESMVEGVQLLDEQGIIRLTNPALDAMFGYERGELIGKHIRDLSMLSPDEYGPLFAEISRRTRTGEVVVGEFQNRRKNGTPFITEAHIGGVLFEGQHYTVAVRLDVTERKRLEQQVLEVSDREQSRIGQDVHDGLCQQLVGIALAAGLAHKDLATQSHPQAETLNRIKLLLDDTLTQARNLAHQLYPVSLVRGGLSLALRELAEDISRQYHLPCRVECPGTIGTGNLEAATHLYRITQEALHNAVKHGAPTRILISLTLDGERAWLTVSDDGGGFVGIQENSAGMGLSIMKYRAGMVGGTIQIQSTPAGGTTVACNFPANMLCSFSDQGTYDQFGKAGPAQSHITGG